MSSIFTRCITLSREDTDFKIHVHSSKLKFWSKQHYIVVEDGNRGFHIDYPQICKMGDELKDLFSFTSMNEVITYFRNKGYNPEIGWVPRR